MATPMTAAQYEAQLKKWGLSAKAYRSNWKTHNRTKATGKTFGGVNGVMLHHTGSDADNPALLYNGYSSLPGPLCHAGNDSKGLIWHIGWGYANHAGSGDQDVLNAVIAENYGANPPTDNQTNADGNKRFYGMEVMYSGSHGMTKAQYNTMIRWAAAICDFHGWTAKSVIGHGEWQPGKWDPGYAPGRMMDMNAVRNDIQDLLDKGPNSTPEKPVNDVVKPAPESKNFKEVWKTDSATPPAGHATKANPYWAPISILRGAYEKAEAAYKTAQEILKIVKEIRERM